MRARAEERETALVAVVGETRVVAHVQRQRDALVAELVGQLEHRSAGERAAAELHERREEIPPPLLVTVGGRHLRSRRCDPAVKLEAVVPAWERRDPLL